MDILSCSNTGYSYFFFLSPHLLKTSRCWKRDCLLKIYLTTPSLSFGIWNLVSWSGIEPRPPALGVGKSWEWLFILSFFTLSLSSPFVSLGHFGVNICPFVHNSCNTASWLRMEATTKQREKNNVSFSHNHSNLIWVSLPQGYLRKLTAVGSRACA